jgi:hypothetical protein
MRVIFNGRSGVFVVDESGFASIVWTDDGSVWDAWAMFGCHGWRARV